MLFPDRELEVRSSWEESFTDPTQHNPNNYRYLVHSVTDELLSGIVLTELHKAGLYESSLEFDLVRNPERIKDRKILACSVIDQYHPGTYSSLGGFILNAPFTNILGAFPGDIGSLSFRNPETFFQKYGSLNVTVAELMIRTHPRSYNEVVLTGGGEENPTQIAGVFIVALDHLTPFQNRTIRRLEIVSNLLGVPLVDLPDPGPLISTHGFPFEDLFSESIVETKIPTKLEHTSLTNLELPAGFVIAPSADSSADFLTKKSSPEEMQLSTRIPGLDLGFFTDADTKSPRRIKDEYSKGSETYKLRFPPKKDLE